MTIFERRQRILEILSQEPGLNVPQFAQLLGVSQGTVRNDLDALADQNRIRRVRGGAVLTSSIQDSEVSVSSFKSRVQRNQSAKNIISNRALKLIGNGDSILLDASTTVYHLATKLSIYHNLRVVTNCIETARVVANCPTNSVMLTGGNLRSDVESVTGPWAEKFLEGLCTRFAFISCSGFTIEGGMTEVDIFESEFRIKAIRSAAEIIALIDSSKFGKVDLAPSIRTGSISHIYTDSNLDIKWISQMEAAGIKFTICQM